MGKAQAKASTKLGQFAAKPAASRKTADAPAATKGTGKTIGVTLRLDPDDWHTLSRYALDKRTSIQKIALKGCALMLEQDGLTLKGAS
jgi:hypothetical protein